MIITIKKLSFTQPKINGNVVVSQVFYKNKLLGFLNATIQPLEFIFYKDDSVQEEFSDELVVMKEYISQQIGYGAKMGLKAKMEFEVRHYNEQGNDILTKQYAEKEL
jgi:hypothetical protein